MRVCSEIKNRGTRDVLIVVCDGLKGLPDAVNAVWEKTIVQTCIVHLLRNSFKYASKRDWAQIAKDLKPVYTAASETEASRFAEFSGKWEKRYPAIIRLWRTRGGRTYAIPAVRPGNKDRPSARRTRSNPGRPRLRWAEKKGVHWPTEQAALKCLYLAIRSLDLDWEGLKRWTNRWKAALNAFDITFDGRLRARDGSNNRGRSYTFRFTDPCQVLVGGRWVDGFLLEWRRGVNNRWQGLVNYRGEGSGRKRAVKDSPSSGRGNDGIKVIPSFSWR